MLSILKLLLITVMGTAEKELLFCDTFNHEGNEELHVDLIRFSVPVVIREVRIVAREQRIPIKIEQIDFDRFGLTYPSFTLDVYCNDSTNPLAPNFDVLGTIEFQNETAVMNIKPKVSSDLVVVRGHYTILTLCLYGNMALPPSAAPGYRSPSPLTRRSGSPYSDSRSRSESYSEDGRSPGRRGGSADRGGEEGDEIGGGNKRIDSYDDLFEPFSPVNSPDHLFELSDDEMVSTKRSTTTPGGYVIEEFSDDEITFENDEFEDYGPDSYPYTEDSWLTSSVSFNPYQCDFAKLESFPSLTETPHEALLARLQKTDASTMKRGAADEASKLRDMALKTKEVTSSQKWVEMMEEIPSFLYPGLAQLQKRSSSEGKEVMQKLVSWTLQCLNLQTARQMPIAINIRQLKAGMRLVPSISALGRKCTHALVKHGVIEKLCELVCADHMSSSLKLLALRAIHTLVNYPQGVERLLGWSGKGSESGKDTTYRRLLNFILSQPPVRVSAAVSSVLRKAHIYELLANLQQSVDKVIASTPVKASSALPEDFWNINGGEEETSKTSGTEDDEFGLDEAIQRSKEPVKVPGKVDSDTAPKEQRHRKKTDQSDEAMEGVEPQEAAPQPIPPDIMRKTVLCLEELKKCLEQAPHTIVQAPLKSFPTKVKCFPDTEEDYFPALVRMFQARRLLECLLVLVSAPSTNLEISVFAGVRGLLLHFMSSQQGLRFLSSNPSVMNSITRTLTQTVENEMPLTATQPLTEFLGGADNADSCTAQNLGLLLIYHLQILQSLDVLRKASKLTMSELESSECLSALHTLYSMTLAPIGKSAVSRMLSQEDNVTALLPFVEPKGHKEHDNKLMKSSVSSRYAAVLILQLLQSSVRGEFLQSYGSRLLVVADFFKENSSPTMSDLYNWLHPVKQLSNSSKAILSLINLIKELTPQVNCTRPGRANAPILTSLRLLYTFITPPDSTQGGQKGLKWMEALTTLFSTSVIDILIALLQKLSDVVLPVWGQRQPLTVSQANVLVLIATFALRIAQTVLSELLSNGDHQYRDTRIIGTLLSLHMVLCSASHSTIISNAAPDIQSLIVDILVMFTKPELVIQEGEENADATSSCWCLMLQELFKHTLSAPHCFLSGLMILSELLPLPLPVQSPQSSTDADVNAVLCLRQLWAVHLGPFLTETTELLEMLMGSSCTALQQALRRVCAQLVDLSPSLATLIARMVIRRIIGEIEKQLEQPDVDSQKEGEAETKKNTYSCLLRMLTFCAVLSQQPAFKIATLDLIRQKETVETKSFSRFIPLLLFLVQKKESSVPAKLCVMSILHALCNAYVALCSNETDDTPLTDQQLSNCLPGQSQLEHITSAVLGHVTSPDQPLATVVLGLKVILSTCQYNAGVIHLYGLLPANIVGFSQLLTRIIDSVKSTSPLTPDILSCVTLFLEVLRQLLTVSITARLEVPHGRRSHSETKTLTFPKPLLKNIVTSEEGAELLEQLKEAVSMKEDESIMEEFSAPITELIEAFSGVKAVKADLPSLEQHSVWPEMGDIERQFELRTGIMVSDNAASSPEYWLSTPPHDESELEPDTTTVDLTVLASESCSGLNLEEELKKRLLPSPPHSPPKQNERKRKLHLTVPEAQKRLKEAMEQRLAMGRKDIFRMRKQNTSRPPSMHVDDFMAIGSGPNRPGRGGAMGMPYMPPHHAGAFMQQLGGRWMGGMHPGMGQYQRRDLASLSNMHRTWDSRLPQSFLSAHFKHPSTAMRSALWGASQLQQAYTRNRSSRGMAWLGGGGGSRPPAAGGGRMGEGWKGRHSAIYKRLI